MSLRGGTTKQSRTMQASPQVSNCLAPLQENEFVDLRIGNELTFANLLCRACDCHASLAM